MRGGVRYAAQTVNTIHPDLRETNTKGERCALWTQQAVWVVCADTAQPDCGSQGA